VRPAVSGGTRRGELQTRAHGYPERRRAKPPVRRLTSGPSPHPQRTRAAPVDLFQIGRGVDGVVTVYDLNQPACAGEARAIALRGWRRSRTTCSVRAWPWSERPRPASGPPPAANGPRRPQGRRCGSCSWTWRRFTRRRRGSTSWLPWSPGDARRGDQGDEFDGAGGFAALTPGSIVARTVTDGWGYVRVAASGELDMSMAPELDVACGSVREARAVALDMSRVSFWTHRGTNLLLRRWQSVARRWCRVVDHPPPAVARVLELAVVADFLPWPTRHRSSRPAG
jgi:hypothetical protein